MNKLQFFVFENQGKKGEEEKKTKGEEQNYNKKKINKHPIRLK